MKMTLLMSAMLFGGVAMATPQITLENPHSESILFQQEKVKIEAESLPDAVKTTIGNDETVKSLKIAEAFQITQLDGTFHYEVVFDDGTEEKLTKKYDQEGNEIKEV
ncbi:hypothetical protein [Algoriphagus pacificus]|uniref:PepSY domain-containing protein n=1 Tax=Algoriphagus pacificus TaxID=2811234 RepID=A0ABS3CJM2_9BACT|nr:hypothetical protein [Algoriphagus pacificus]MBN7816960.1 hypothetical protein [Algoriphagus pacificus]